MTSQSPDVFTSTKRRKREDEPTRIITEEEGEGLPVSKRPKFFEEIAPGEEFMIPGYIEEEALLANLESTFIVIFTTALGMLDLQTQASLVDVPNFLAQIRQDINNTPFFNRRQKWINFLRVILTPLVSVTDRYSQTSLESGSRSFRFNRLLGDLSRLEYPLAQPTPSFSAADIMR